MRDGVEIHDDLFNVDGFESMVLEKVELNLTQSVAAERRTNINFRSISLYGKKRGEVCTSECEQWKIQRSTVRGLVYFNVGLLTYNAVLFIYACMMWDSDNYPYLICFNPILSMLQILILYNFTLRYYRIATAICIYFTSDLER